MAKSNIYIFTYNNYFNRIIKKENSLANYGTPVYTLLDTNFDYADGVTTQHVFNYDGTGDYLIVTDAENNILHRWFIIEPKKTRGGQHLLELRRDLIIDYYDIVVTAPMIVSRAMIANPDNPLLFNPEGFSFNQIKKREILLDDGSESRWYYLYFKKDAPEETITVNLNENAFDLKISGTIQSYFTYLDQNVSNIKIDKFMFRANCLRPAGKVAYNWEFNSNVESEITGYMEDSTGSYHRIDLDETPFVVDYNVKEMLAENYNALSSAYFTDITTDLVTDEQYRTWTSLNGKKIKDSTGKIYLVSVSTTQNSSDWEYIDYTEQDYPATVAAYINMIETNKSSIYYDDGTNYGTEALRVYFTERKIFVHVDDITAQSGSLTFKLFDSTGNYVTTDDSEYKIISLPADRIVYNINGDYYTDPTIIQKIIREISVKYTGQLVDIQLLPYCNYHETIYEGTVYPMDISIYQVQYLTHTENNATVKDGFIYYVDSSNFSFNIYRSLSIGNYDNNVAKNKKIANEVELWRLVSPNYDGQFEFSVAKNDGIDYFNVDVTLKPFNPYIHVNPNFKGLYGQDFDDARGLICNGDFSMPMETSAWEEYELRNKNYQIAFNRQIEHMDFTHQQERVQAGFGMASGTVSGAAMGALAGSQIGGPIGAGVGAAIGGIASLAGGIGDYAMIGARQREDKDFAIDNFKYQLGNIKALPNSISKVTPLTYNNKKFPFIEMYSCTDEEVNILKNKIHYNSMTVNAVGTIQEYQQSGRTFISGTLIRLEGTGLANNELFELYDELKKGVYI